MTDTAVLYFIWLKVDFFLLKQKMHFEWSYIFFAHEAICFFFTGNTDSILTGVGEQIVLMLSLFFK